MRGGRAGAAAMAYVFAATGQAVAPVAGSSDLLPIHRVYCVGRNYAEHAREMGHSGREDPFFFAKPADAVFAVAEGQVGKLEYPSRTADLHYEAELVVALGGRGKDVPAQRAAELVWGYAVGLDMTRRDLQSAMKKQGRPWEIGKSFDRSAPISPVRPARLSGIVERGRIWLDVNGQRRQDADISDLIWSVDEIIEHLSRYFQLEAGDLIFTGTPAGVGAVVAGDVMRAGVDGVGSLAVAVTAPSSGT
jgi:fumarylpyruvate hydrolase